MVLEGILKVMRRHSNYSYNNDNIMSIISDLNNVYTEHYNVNSWSDYEYRTYYIIYIIIYRMQSIVREMDFMKF